MCNLCPRKCNTDRQKQNGLCGANDSIRVARAARHFWEEPCISGKNGSGTVFFSGCSLGCVFCQNSDISKRLLGEVVTKDELYNIFFRLKNEGAHNINLVTCDHYIAQVLPVIKKARKDKIGIPFVLNTSSYITKNVARALKDDVDIYLADFKFFNEATAKKYANAPDYPKVATDAIDEMVKNAPEPVFKDGLMIKGVIVRVLVLPDNVIEAKQIIKHIYERYGNRVYISIMSQYTPVAKSDYPELMRKLTEREYKSVVDYASRLGITQAFCQQISSADKKFIPDFERNL